MKRNLKNSLSDLTWPWWFPYPSSWLRTLILVPLAFPLNSLIMLGAFGIFFSALERNLIIFTLTATVGLILPAFILAFIYHICWYKWQKSSPEARLGWFPQRESLVQGLTATLVMMFSFIVLLILFLIVIHLDCQLLFVEAGKEPGTELISTCMARSLGRISGVLARQTTHVWDVEGRGVFVQYGGDIDARPWFFIWVIIAAYFYQAEYGLKKLLIPELQKKWRLRQKQKTVPKIDPIDLELGKLRGEMGLTAVRKGATPMMPIAKARGNPKRLQSRLLFGLSLAALTGTLAFYLGWQHLSRPQPIIIASSPTVVTPQPEPFSAAVRAATEASQLAQTAKTPADWQLVATQWQTAATLMKSVPSESAKSSLARQKEIEYEKNFQYAKTNAEKK